LPKPRGRETGFGAATPAQADRESCDRRRSAFASEGRIQRPVEGPSPSTSDCSRYSRRHRRRPPRCSPGPTAIRTRSTPFESAGASMATA